MTMTITPTTPATTTDMNTTRKRMNARTAICYTLEIDPRELSEYQYQPGVFPRAVYDLGNTYFCAGKRPPNPAHMKHLAGVQWTRNPDQYWAEQAGTVIWRAAVVA